MNGKSQTSMNRGDDLCDREVLLRLMEHSFRCYDSRRTYEWKLPLALWASMGALVVAVWQTEVPVDRTIAITSASLFTLFAIALVLLFSWAIQSSHKADQQKMYYYENSLISGTSFNWWKPDSWKQLNQPRGAHYRLLQAIGRARYSAVIHMFLRAAITALLGLALIAALWSSTEPHS